MGWPSQVYLGVTARTLLPPTTIMTSLPRLGKVKTTVAFLKAGHLLEQSYEGCFRLDTDNPILSHIDEHLFEQQS